MEKEGKFDGKIRKKKVTEKNREGLIQNNVRKRDTDKIRKERLRKRQNIEETK